MILPTPQVSLVNMPVNLQRKTREPKRPRCASPPTQCDRGKPEEAESGTHFKKVGFSVLFFLSSGVSYFQKLITIPAETALLEWL